MLNIKGLARLTIEDFKQIWRTFSENVTDKSYSIGLGKPLKVHSKKLIGRYHIMEKLNTDKCHLHTVLIARDEGGFFVHCGTIAGESSANDAVCSFFTRPYALAPHKVGVCKHIKMLFSDDAIRKDYLDILLDCVDKRLNVCYKSVVGGVIYGTNTQTTRHKRSSMVSHRASFAWSSWGMG